MKKLLLLSLIFVAVINCQAQNNRYHLQVDNSRYDSKSFIEQLERGQQEQEQWLRQQEQEQWLRQQEQQQGQNRYQQQGQNQYQPNYQYSSHTLMIIIAVIIIISRIVIHLESYSMIKLRYLHFCKVKVLNVWKKIQIGLV